MKCVRNCNKMCIIGILQLVNTNSDPNIPID